jgi:Ca2+-binding RTX toxin-like protein
MEVWTVGTQANSTGANANIQVANLISIENIAGSRYGDTLIGDSGVNRIEGGLGNDILLGRGGSDTFVFKNDLIDQDGIGFDQINDFSAGVGAGDVIEISGFGSDLDTFAEILTNTTDVGGISLINLGSSTIHILGVLKSQLAADDFVFV